MKYKVKFKCYQYNTGDGNNGSYMSARFFDSLDEAKSFRDRVNEQYLMENKRTYLTDNPTEYQKEYEMCYYEYSKWRESFDLIDIDDGCLYGKAKIFEYYPAVEVEINE